MGIQVFCNVIRLLWKLWTLYCWRAFFAPKFEKRKQRKIDFLKWNLCRGQSLIKSVEGNIVGRPPLTANGGKSDEAPIGAKMRPNKQRTGAIWNSQVIRLYWYLLPAKLNQSGEITKLAFFLCVWGTLFLSKTSFQGWYLYEKKVKLYHNFRLQYPGTL